MQEGANAEASVGPTLEGSSTGTPDSPVLCNKLDEGNEGRQEPGNVPTPASQDPRTNVRYV